MADDDDSLTQHEDDFLQGMSWKAKRYMRKMDRRCEELEDWEVEADDVRHRKIEAIVLAAGLAASLALLYSLWIFSLGSGEKFRFTIRNAWPAVLFAGLLVGHRLHDWIERLHYETYLFKQFWQQHGPRQRLEMWSNRRKWPHAYCVCRKCRRGTALHPNPCRCWKCSLKRRWRSWKTPHRHKITEGHWHRDNRSGVESRSSPLRRRKRNNQH